MKKISFSTAAIAVLSAFILGCSGYAFYKYKTIDTGMLGKHSDAVPYYGNDGNVNVMLTRNDNWHKIATQRLLSYKDFAGIDGSTATIPITAELARQFCDAKDKDELKQNYVGNFVGHRMTDVAYDNLINKRDNNISWYDQKNHIVSRKVCLVFATPPSEDEYQTAEQLGVELEVEPVALDGFVFITHKDNPVDSLTVEQIQDIYSGKITNWKDVGGKDEKIRPFQRTKNSGSQTAMEEMVMKGKPMAEAPIAIIAHGMGELVEMVAEYENESAAIGYTYYYYINNLYKNPDIKVININGVSPGNENLVTRKYPFTASYYAVIRSDEPEDSVYRKLRDYMLTDEGQEIVRMAGYCPLKG